MEKAHPTLHITYKEIDMQQLTGSNSHPLSGDKLQSCAMAVALVESSMLRTASFTTDGRQLIAIPSLPGHPIIVDLGSGVGLPSISAFNRGDLPAITDGFGQVAWQTLFSPCGRYLFASAWNQWTVWNIGDFD